MEVEKLTEDLKGCYRKYKSTIFFQPSLTFRKKQIALFESDKTAFDLAFERLAFALSKKDELYFNDLISKTSIFVLPKNIKINNEKSFDNIFKVDAIAIEETNEFINGPIELFIIDIYLTMILGNQINNCNPKCYANKLDNEAYEKGKPIYSNLKLFKYYYKQYKAWKNEAIRRSFELYKEHKDSTIISLDIYKYFYSVNIHIEKILNRHFIVYDDLTKFCIKIMQNLFDKYSVKIKKYKTFVKDNTVLPIGLNISCLLANLYLKDFDNKFDSRFVHYGRYVDDILIVIEGCGISNLPDFNKKYDIFKSLEGYYYLKNNHELRIEAKKFRCIFIHAKGSSEIISNLYTEEFTASEPNLFPNFDDNLSNSLNNLYNRSDFVKFREANAPTINIQNIIKSINGFFLSTKGTNANKTINKQKSIKSSLLNFIHTLKSDNIISLHTRWNKIILLLALSRDIQLLNTLKQNFINTINKISFTDCYIAKEIKENLKILLCDGLCSAAALLGNPTIIEKKPSNSTISLVENYINSNMFDYYPIKYPLINFLKNTKPKLDLTIIKFDPFINLIEGGFDYFKIKYSPYFIPLKDFLFIKQIYYITHNISYELHSFISEYLETIGYLFINRDSWVNLISSTEYNNNIKTTFYKIENIKPSPLHLKSDKIYIGLANINYNNLKILNKSETKLINTYLSRFYKSQFISLLNQSYIKDFTINTKLLKLQEYSKIESKKKINKKMSNQRIVNYLLFPELFLPLEWFDLLCKFSMTTQATVITGIRYIIYKNYAFNLVVSIIPFVDKNNHRQVIPFFHQKNFLPMYERNILNNSNLKIPQTFKTITVFDDSKIKFAPFLCYEITDIESRSVIKNKVNYIFTINYNRDTNYFNNIGSSTSRDLYCFYIECNALNFGSTSYAPYRTKYSKIAYSKSNLKNYIQIIETDLNELKKYKNTYFESFDKFKSVFRKERINKLKKYAKPSAGTTNF